MRGQKSGKPQLRQRLRDWYRGQYVPPRPNDPDSPLVVISPGHYEQPLFAKLLRTLGRFWLDRWQWIIGTTVAVLALTVAVLALIVTLNS